MPLSLDEATKRYESYSQNIQDSILIMESFMGSHESISFDLPQVISNLESIDTHTEEKNVTAQIKVLEEYQRMLVMERKRTHFHIAWMIQREVFLGIQEV